MVHTIAAENAGFELALVQWGVPLVLSATMPSAHAQQPGKPYRIAIVHPSEPVAEMSDTGLQELRRLGYAIPIVGLMADPVAPLGSSRAWHTPGEL
jgi:hypothetical protein